MKKVLVALLLVVLVGCGRPAPQPTPWTPPQPTPAPAPTPNPQPTPNPVDPTVLPLPSVLTEAHTGKTFAVANGGKVNVQLAVNADPNYFWSVGGDGDFEVLSDNRVNGKEVFSIQVNQTGTLRLTYKKFGDNGAETLSEVTYGVKVQ